MLHAMLSSLLTVLVPMVFLWCHRESWRVLLARHAVHSVANISLTTVELVEDSWWRSVAKRQTGRELAAHQCLVPSKLEAAASWGQAYGRLGVIWVLISTSFSVLVTV